jgi:hypothetical protein
MDVEQTIRELKFKLTEQTAVNTAETNDSLKNFINKTDIFENGEALEALEIFIKKIQD